MLDARRKKGVLKEGAFIIFLLFFKKKRKEKKRDTNVRNTEIPHGNLANFDF